MTAHALPLLASALTLLSLAPVQAAQAKPDQATVDAIAPSGVLRAAINLGNAVLAQQDASGELKGASVQLAKALGERLGVKVQLVPYHEAGETFAAGARGEWDVAFLAVDPKRAELIDYGPAYVVIDGTYVVRADSPFHTIADVDREGARISVAEGAAYTLYLARTLKHAQLVQLPNGAASLEAFEAQHLDASASVGAVLRAMAKTHPEWRVISPGFQTIEQAMALPKGRPPEALAYVGRFIEEMKASGFVRRALDETGQADTAVAPPASL